MGRKTKDKKVADDFWEIECIKRERDVPTKGYLVQWKGVDEKGKPWKDSWVSKADVTHSAVREWTLKKAEKEQAKLDQHEHEQTEEAPPKMDKKQKKRECEEKEDEEEKEEWRPAQEPKKQRGRASHVPTPPRLPQQPPSPPVGPVASTSTASPVKAKPRPKDAKRIKVVDRKKKEPTPTEETRPHGKASPESTLSTRYYEILFSLARSACRIAILHQIADKQSKGLLNIVADDPLSDYDQFTTEVVDEDLTEPEDVIEDYLQWHFSSWKDTLKTPDAIARTIEDLATPDVDEDYAGGLKATQESLALLKYLDEKGREMADLAGATWYGVGYLKPLKSIRSAFAQLVGETAPLDDLPRLKDIMAYQDAKREY